MVLAVVITVVLILLVERLIVMIVVNGNFSTIVEDARSYISYYIFFPSNVTKTRIASHEARGNVVA
jgi:hypothetical protein